MATFSWIDCCQELDETGRIEVLPQHLQIDLGLSRGSRVALLRLGADLVFETYHVLIDQVND